MVFEHNPYNPVTARIFARAPIDRGCHMIKPQRCARPSGPPVRATRLRATCCSCLNRSTRLLGFVEPALSWLPLGGQYFVAGRKPGAPSR